MPFKKDMSTHENKTTYENETTLVELSEKELKDISAGVTGTVKWFAGDKGFGFIDGEVDLSVPAV